MYVIKPLPLKLSIQSSALHTYIGKDDFGITFNIVF